MFIQDAYARRDDLSDVELERLSAALKDEVARYQFAIRNYPPDRMERYGKPHLATLQERGEAVRRLIRDRARRVG